jgi:Xaa-Pro aminopeptidase
MGLDVHDPGEKDIPLQKGMVLTCEPGLYISEENIAVRIETDLLVDDNPVDLLSGIPVEADEIEYLMSKN